jgi:hypothetical protein
MATPRPQVFVIQDFSKESEGIFKLIFSAAATAGASVFRADGVVGGGNFRQSIGDAMLNADLIIADATFPHSDLMYEIGFALAQKKPFILIAETGRSVPLDLAGIPVLVFDRSDSSEFVGRLAKLIRHALKTPDDFIFPKVMEEKSKRQSVFVSYSHNDQEYLDRLLVHLKPLERDGLIDLWADTKLRAGDRWKKEIEKALQKATVAVLLVSADFLSSDFIINNELPPLLKNAEERGVRIIPVIVKPCRFARDQNLKHFQSVNDPKDSLIRLSVGEQELIYDQVASEIEQTLSKI